MNMTRKTFVKAAVTGFTALVLGGFSTAVAADVNTLTADEKADGWTLLWDGQTTNGWASARKLTTFPVKGWVMKDGELTIQPRSGAGDIVTTKKYRHFAFKFDFRLTKAANSGVKYFYDEKQNRGTTEEYQILENAHHDSSKGRNGNRKCASLYDIIPANADSIVKGVGEWNTGMIVSKGAHVEHWLNGKKVLEYDRGTEEFRKMVKASKYSGNGKTADGKPQPWGEIPEGRILLQDHNDSTVSFRNLKIKELCYTPTATAVSPDGKNEIRLWTNPLAYDVVREGVVVVGFSEIGMKVDGACLKSCGEPQVTTRKLSGTVETPVYKKAEVNLAGTETFVDFGDWGVRLVARDDGVAYRFETEKAGKMTVNCEKASLAIPDAEARCAFTETGCTAYGREESIPHGRKVKDVHTTTDGKKGSMVYLPFVYSVGGEHVAVTESGLCDYPAWYLTRDYSASAVVFNSRFAPEPLEVQENHGRKRPVIKYSDYLVKTDGTRAFPWRTFVLADKPSDFCAADIVFALARPQAEGSDFSWVKPGKVAWDWWNVWDNLGQEKGCTTAGYKRFIDFAAKTGVEYVILDEGWSQNLNIWKFHPNVDVPEIIRYGNEKGVGIVLWMAWAQAYGNEEKVAEHFAKMGAKGFKVDFIDRADADSERFLWKFAEACVKHKVFVDYHGVARPTGLNRTYPHVLNYEGVHGLEQMKWYQGHDFTDNDVRVFFLRMTAGPMDYTPGAMDNYPIGKYKGGGNNPGSVGTRVHQMAMMAAYEAPFQMLCDAPTKYEKNMESFSFMAQTPVVWDKTIGLGGCPDSYAMVARKAKDGAWYVAAINNATAREVEVDTAFLEKRFLSCLFGAGTWTAEIFRDADDSDENATNYIHETKSVKAGEKLTFRMAKGGGLIVKFTK